MLGYTIYKENYNAIMGEKYIFLTLCVYELQKENASEDLRKTLGTESEEFYLKKLRRLKDFGTDTYYTAWYNKELRIRFQANSDKPDRFYSHSVEDGKISEWSLKIMKKALPLVQDRDISEKDIEEFLKKNKTIPLQYVGEIYGYVEKKEDNNESV